MAELLVLFKDAQNSRGPWPHHQSFRRASLRSPSSKTGGAAKGIPVLLTTELLLFCSPRDRRFLRAGLGEPPPDGIWIAGVVRTPSSPFRLAPDGFGPGPAGPGMRPAGSSVSPWAAACPSVVRLATTAKAQ
jgi:hypothetical protein